MSMARIVAAHKGAQYSIPGDRADEVAAEVDRLLDDLQQPPGERPAGR